MDPLQTSVGADDAHNGREVGDTDESEVVHLEEVRAFVRNYLDAEEQIVDEAGPCYTNTECFLRAQVKLLESVVLNLEEIGDFE